MRSTDAYKEGNENSCAHHKNYEMKIFFSARKPKRSPVAGQVTDPSPLLFANAVSACVAADQRCVRFGGGKKEGKRGVSNSAATQAWQRNWSMRSARALTLIE